MAFHKLDLGKWYHLKWVKASTDADGNGTVTIYIADHSVSPLKYQTYKYMEDIVAPLGEKLVSFFVDVQREKFRPTDRCNIKWLALRNRDTREEIVDRGTLIRNDSLYNTGFELKLQKYIAEHYMVPEYLGLQNMQDVEFEKNFIGWCRCAWDKEKKKLEEQHIFATERGSGSHMYGFPGKVICIDPVFNRLIIGNAENYDVNGRLDNSDGTAVVLPSGSGCDIAKFVLGTKSNEWFESMSAKYPMIKQLEDVFVPDAATL